MEDEAGCPGDEKHWEEFVLPIGSQFPYFCLMRAESRKYRKQIVWKNYLVCDLEDFDFPHLESQ
jgi:hypothetical protein